MHLSIPAQSPFKIVPSNKVYNLVTQLLQRTNPPPPDRSTTHTRRIPGRPPLKSTRLLYSIGTRPWNCGITPSAKSCPAAAKKKESQSWNPNNVYLYAPTFSLHNPSQSAPTARATRRNPLQCTEMHGGGGVQDYKFHIGLGCNKPRAALQPHIWREACSQFAACH